MGPRTTPPRDPVADSAFWPFFGLFVLDVKCRNILTPKLTPQKRVLQITRSLGGGWQWGTPWCEKVLALDVSPYSAYDEREVEWLLLPGMSLAKAGGNRQDTGRDRA